MRIACLQFAPQVGDINNNLNRADAVLSRSNPDDLDGLDVLVLPELAFTGYNFKSLQHISPCLEPTGAGISSLWARTTALKYNCNVIVGYPEKADVSEQWPTSPEYYSSTIVVNEDGETVANYRKCFLYAIDETWALEGRDGFFEGYLDGLGQTAMGICMDLNPYKFEAPWHAFEFGYHVLEVQANLVIVTMAWLTREESRDFSRMPQEPDMETLTYWVQRLEPVIRSEQDEEVIVVFCNRSGSEDEAVYAGTSAVVGILDGEVKVYGLLGRGVKDLLVVDTAKAPYAKLVYRPDGTGSSSVAAGLLGPPHSPTASRHDEFTNGVEATSPRHRSGELLAESSQALASTAALASPSRSRNHATAPQITIPQTESRWRKQNDSYGTNAADGGNPSRRREDSPHYSRSVISQGTRDIHILGGNISISQEEYEYADEDVEINSASDTLSTKYFWPTASSVSDVPRESRWPTASQSELPVVASSLLWAKPLGSPSFDRRRSIQTDYDDLSSIMSSHGSYISSKSARSNRAHLNQKRSQHGDSGRSAGPSRNSARDDYTRPNPRSPDAHLARRPSREIMRSATAEEPRTRPGEEPGSTRNRSTSALSRFQTFSSAEQHPDIKPVPQNGRPRMTPSRRSGSQSRDRPESQGVDDNRRREIGQSTIPIAVSPSIFDGKYHRSLSGVMHDDRPNERAGQVPSRSNGASREQSGSTSDLEAMRLQQNSSVPKGAKSPPEPLYYGRSNSRDARRGNGHTPKRSPSGHNLASRVSAGPEQRSSSELRGLRDQRDDDEIVAVRGHVDPHCHVHGIDAIRSSSNPPGRSVPSRGNESSRQQIREPPATADGGSGRPAPEPWDSGRSPNVVDESSASSTYTPGSGSTKFAPTTPKAMNLQGFEPELLSATAALKADPLNDLIKPSETATGAALVDVPERPKSAVW